MSQPGYAFLLVVIPAAVEDLNRHPGEVPFGIDDKKCIVSPGTDLPEEFNTIHIRHQKITKNRINMP